MTHVRTEEQQQAEANEHLAPLRDPGPEVANKIISDLIECRWSPSEVARKARFLRAHIDTLRDPGEFSDLVRELAECPLTTETPGVALDGLGDALILAARGWVAAN